MESTCTCFIQLGQCYAAAPEHISALAEHGLVPQLLRLVTGCEGSLLEGGLAIAPPVSQQIFIGLLKLLTSLAASSAKIRQDILDAGAANVLSAMLSTDGRSSGGGGASAAAVLARTGSGPTGSPLVVCNSAPQLTQALALVNALLPGLKIDGMPIDLDIDLKTLRTQPASAAAIIGAGSGGGGGGSVSTSNK